MLPWVFQVTPLAWIGVIPPEVVPEMYTADELSARMLLRETPWVPPLPLMNKLPEVVISEDTITAVPGEEAEPFRVAVPHFRMIGELTFRPVPPTEVDSEHRRGVAQLRQVARQTNTISSITSYAR